MDHSANKRHNSDGRAWHPIAPKPVPHLFRIVCGGVGRQPLRLARVVLFYSTRTHGRYCGRRTLRMDQVQELTQMLHAHGRRHWLPRQDGPGICPLCSVWKSQLDAKPWAWSVVGMESMVKLSAPVARRQESEREREKK